MGKFIFINRHSRKKIEMAKYNIYKSPKLIKIIKMAKYQRPKLFFTSVILLSKKSCIFAGYVIHQKT